MIRAHSRLMLVATAVLAATSPAFAQVQILNQSFEFPVVGPNGVSSNNVTNWTAVGSAAYGVFHPTTQNWGYTAPACNQLLYTNSGLVEQATPAVLSVGDTYTLEVDVINRPIFFNQNYKVQLVAGETLLAEDAGTLTPPVGGSLVSKLVFTAPAGHPALGQPIKVRLGGPTQCNFDNVRLNGTPPSCYADCDGNCGLSIDDFICFQTFFAIGDPYADCDGDSILSIDDFICFQTFFAVGC